MFIKDSYLNSTARISYRMFLSIMFQVAIMLCCVMSFGLKIRWTLQEFSIFGTLVICLCFLCYRLASGTYRSPYYLFFASFVLFQYGIFFMFLFDSQFDYWYLHMVEDVYLISGAKYTILGISAFNLGGILALGFTEGKKVAREWILNGEAITIIAGIFYVVISLIAWPLTIYFGILGFKTGYLSVAGVAQETSNFLVFARTFYVSASVLYYVYTPSNKVKKIVGIVLVVYGAVTLLIGSRGEGLSIILIFFLFPILYAPKVNIRKIVIVSVSVLLCATLAPLIGQLRVGTYEEKINTISSGKIILENPILQTIQELGSSFITIPMVQKVIPATEDYKYGISYLGAIGSALPESIDPTGIINYCNKKASLSSWLMEKYNMNFGPGFSLIAESYYNFGQFGLLVLTLLGCILGYLFRKKNEFKSKFSEYVQFVLLVQFMTLPRNESLMFVKCAFNSIVLVYCILYIGTQIISNIHKKRY